jgi:folate-binding protein YgfZ
MSVQTDSRAARDYRALREDAGAVDLAGWTVLRLAGPDTRAFLQGTATQDLEGPPPPGETGAAPAAGAAAATPAAARATLFLTEKGRPVALAWIHVEPGGAAATVIADAGARATLRAHLERFLVMEEVEIAGPEGMPRVIGFPGPARATRLRAALEALEREPAASLAKVPARRTPRAAALDATPLSFLLAPAETPAEVLPPFVDPAAFEAWRIAAGLPRSGLDFDLDRIATELSLADAISFSKGCYVGQEVVARTSHRGQARRERVGFRLPWPDEPIPPHAPIVSGDRTIGFMTSAAREPGSDHGLGMGYVATEDRRALLAAGAPPVALLGGPRIPIRLLDWPL